MTSRPRTSVSSQQSKPVGSKGQSSLGELLPAEGGVAMDSRLCHLHALARTYGASGQLVAAVRTGCVQGSTELSHLIPAPAGTCHSWDGQVGKTTPMSSPSQAQARCPGSYLPSPWTTVALAAPEPFT